jgi:DNA-binding NarL/FixJ family response regulator
MQMTRTLTPDVLLLDIAMPRMGGIESLSARQGSDTRVIVLTAAISEPATVCVPQLGARGVSFSGTKVPSPLYFWPIVRACADAYAERVYA